MMAALSSNLLEIDWKTLESEVHLPPFHKLRTLDSDDLSSLLVVYMSMYGEIITSVNCLSKTVRRFGSIIIDPEKFGSKYECRFLRCARITASWTDNHGSIRKHFFLVAHPGFFLYQEFIPNLLLHLYQ